MTDLPSEQEARKSLGSIRVGEVRAGRVVGISEQEALVELEGFSGPESVTGRIPGRDLSRRTSGHPSELVEIGQRLTFEVFYVDHEQAVVWGSAAACEDPALRAFLLALRLGASQGGSCAQCPRVRRVRAPRRRARGSVHGVHPCARADLVLGPPTGGRGHGRPAGCRGDARRRHASGAGPVVAQGAPAAASRALRRQSRPDRVGAGHRAGAVRGPRPPDRRGGRACAQHRVDRRAHRPSGAHRP
ncbi:S1 RNA-binding domain-containing protein [Streptomyces sp. SID7760]|nr:S1 RNA-binding domain-containing protein [Streptomyces sp. SID7760]